MSLKELRFPFIHLRHDHANDINPREWVHPLLATISAAHVSCIFLPLEIYYNLADDTTSSEGAEEETDLFDETFYRRLDRLDWPQVDKLLVEMQGRSSLSKVVIELGLMEFDFPIAKRAMEKLLPKCMASELVLEVRLLKSGTDGSH